MDIPDEQRQYGQPERKRLKVLTGTDKQNDHDQGEHHAKRNMADEECATQERHDGNCRGHAQSTDAAHRSEEGCEPRCSGDSVDKPARHCFVLSIYSLALTAIIYGNCILQHDNLLLHHVLSFWPYVQSPSAGYDKAENSGPHQQ